MKKTIILSGLFMLILFVITPTAFSFLGGKFKEISPENGVVKIFVKDVNDGKAHFFKVKAKDEIFVKFFVIQAKDGVIRAAVDACDVCFRSGKGYVQQGDYMVCENCGQKFLSTRINHVKGGCNPAPIERKVVNDALLIEMTEIDKNSWYCEYK